jgi:hypothetical protein
MKLFSIYGRPRSPLALIVSGCMSSILVLHFLYASEILPGTRPKAINPAILLARQSTFWRSFYHDLVKFGPNCDPLTHPEDAHLNLPYDASDTNRTRPDRLSMSASQSVTDKSYNPTQEQGLHIAIPSRKPRHRDHCRRIPPSRGSGFYPHTSPYWIRATCGRFLGFLGHAVSFYKTYLMLRETTNRFESARINTK